MDHRSEQVRAACMALNDAARAKQAARVERRQMRALKKKLKGTEQDDAPSCSESSDGTDDDGDGPGLMAHKVTTYFPATYTERNSLSDEWRRAEAERRAAAIAEAEHQSSQQPMRVNHVGWTAAPKRVAPVEPTVKELLEQQAAMAYEAGVVERMRQQAEREHIRLLGRTDDVAGGRMDAILRRAREISLRDPGAMTSGAGPSLEAPDGVTQSISTSAEPSPMVPALPAKAGGAADAAPLPGESPIADNPLPRRGSTRPRDVSFA